MNWFNPNDATDAVDTWISSSIYPDSVADTDGINLRYEIHGILYGFPGKRPLGHWVVLRHFDRTRTSRYYNSFSNEGLGGPKYLYTDTLLKTRRIPYPRSDTESPTKASTVFSDKMVYYFEYDVQISNGDQIFELDVTDHTFRPTSYNLEDKYNVKRLHPYRMEDGNVAYFAALSELDNISY